MTYSDHENIDDDLHAFVDGQLDSHRRAEVEAYLATHPDQQRRVQDWAMQAEQLRRHFTDRDTMTRDLILTRVANAQLGRSNLIRRMAIAASVALALGLGGVGGWMLRGEPRPSEVARLGIEAETAYHVFANDTDRPVEITSDNRAELVSWMTQKLGRRMTVPDLAPMGYHLLGGRVLTAMYGPAAMLIYRDADDNRITVYLQPMRIGRPTPMQKLQAQSVDGYTWIDRQVGYSVMSDGDRTQLEAVAHRVHAAAEF